MRIVRAIKGMVALLVRGDARLRSLDASLRQLHKNESEITSRLRQIEKTVEHLEAKRIAALHDAFAELRAEIRDWRQQTTLQLQRLQSPPSSQGGKDTPAAPSLGGPAIPLTVTGPGPSFRPPADGVIHPDPEDREWLCLSECPYCAHPASTPILRWNKIVMLEVAPDESSARYDFVMCHACGVLYASRRPVGTRFRYLLEHFGEVTAKHGGGAEFKNPLLNPYALTPEDEARLRTMAARGVFVSEHLGLSKREYLDGLAKDRFENSVHVDLLANLVPLKDARVLELRPRTGAIAESLRRLFGADVSVVPMWESQQFLLKEVYGFESRGLVDYDHFVSPFAGPFDVIVCNHMLTHMLRPAEFLRELRSRLTPDGYVYFYNEPDEAEYVAGGQSMIAHFNPLHMHGFDRPSLGRMLAANGFEVIYVRGRDQNHLCLARRSEHTEWLPLADEARTARIAGLQAARDRAILKMPPDMRGRVAESWSGALQRALELGDVEFDHKGQLRFVSTSRRKP